MDKGSKIQANDDRTIYFATKHGKEAVLRPLLSPLGFECEVLAVDTDKFGTFSGEVPRAGSIRETLRKKLVAAQSLAPDRRYYLASEGTFGPPPSLPFLQMNLESLLLWDTELGIEIYAESVSTDTVHSERIVSPLDDLQPFLSLIGFPEHGLMVHPEGTFTPIYKGIHDPIELDTALHRCFLLSSTGRVVLSTDLRANHNKTRRAAIAKVGERLIEKLKSLCPKCNMPGFSITRGLPGLACSACGIGSYAPEKVLWECVKCTYSEARQHPDGKTSLDPSECEECNP